MKQADWIFVGMVAVVVFLFASGAHGQVSEGTVLTRQQFLNINFSTVSLQCVHYNNEIARGLDGKDFLRAYVDCLDLQALDDGNYLVVRGQQQVYAWQLNGSYARQSVFHPVQTLATCRAGGSTVLQCWNNVFVDWAVGRLNIFKAGRRAFWIAEQQRTLAETIDTNSLTIPANQLNP